MNFELTSSTLLCVGLQPQRKAGFQFILGVGPTEMAGSCFFQTSPNRMCPQKHPGATPPPWGAQGCVCFGDGVHVGGGGASLRDPPLRGTILSVSGEPPF